MNNTNWTLGRGIGYGLKLLSIMGMIIAMLSFAQFLFKFSAGYYDNEFSQRGYPPKIIEPRDENLSESRDLSSLFIEQCEEWKIIIFNFNGSNMRTISYDNYDEIKKVCKDWYSPLQEDCVFYDEKNISWTVTVRCINYQEIIDYYQKEGKK